VFEFEIEGMDLESEAAKGLDGDDGKAAGHTLTAITSLKIQLRGVNKIHKETGVCVSTDNQLDIALARALYPVLMRLLESPGCLLPIQRSQARVLFCTTRCLGTRLGSLLSR